MATEESDERWWSQETVAVVTGANKGVGFAIAKKLAESGITVVLTSRDVKRGEEATQKLVDQGLPVVLHQLDVTSPTSVQEFADWLKQQYGYVDILVNNAGILPEGPDHDSAKSVLETNYYGVKRVTSAILPLLRASEAGARILNVTSRAGQLFRLEYDDAVKVLKNVDELSEEILDKLANEFLEDVKEQKQSKWISHTFPPPYTVSKAILNAYTRLLAKELDQRPAGQKVYLNVFCPGYTKTDMLTSYLSTVTGPLAIPYGDQPVFIESDEAAENAAWLILLPASKSPSGIFSGERGVVEY